MAQPHVVVLTHDSWRRDHFTPEITPRSWAFAQQGARFDAAFATGSSTAFAFTGILASAYPSTYGMRVDPLVLMLDENLRQHGYHTAALIENVIILHPYFGFYDNVDHYKYRNFADDANEFDGSTAYAVHSVEWGFNVKRSRLSRLVEMGISNVERFRLGWIERVVKDVRAHARGDPRAEFELTGKLHTSYAEMCKRYFRSLDLSRPQFVHMHTVMPHAAFWAPPDLYEKAGVDEDDLVRAAHLMLRGIVTRKGRETMRRAYRAGAMYADQFFGEILDVMEKRGMLESSIVALSADHGEQLYENGYFGHSRAVSVDDHVLRVPLAIRAPGVRPQVIDAAVSMLDLAPTIADLAGAARPRDWEGRSHAAALLAGTPPEPRPVCTEAWQLQDLLRAPTLEQSGFSCMTARDEDLLLKIDRRGSEVRSSVYRWREDPSFERPLPEAEAAPAIERLGEVVAAKRRSQESRRLAIEKRRALFASMQAAAP